MECAPSCLAFTTDHLTHSKYGVKGGMLTAQVLLGEVQEEGQQVVLQGSTFRRRREWAHRAADRQVVYPSCWLRVPITMVCTGVETNNKTK